MALWDKAWCRWIDDLGAMSERQSCTSHKANESTGNGISPERVDWALQSTNGTLEAALDHLEAHQDEAMPADAMAAAPQPTSAADPHSTEAPEVNVCTE